MKNRLMMVLAITSALFLAVAASASAFPMSGPRWAPIGPGIARWFSDHGVDPMYLGKAQSEVPADQWEKIVALENDPALAAVIESSLRNYVSALGDDVFLRIGNKYFNYASGLPGSYQAAGFSESDYPPA